MSREAAIRERVFIDAGALRWRATGEVIRGYTDRDGYSRFKVRWLGRTFDYGAHRVVWFLHHGAWPFPEIDHINRDPSDNRIENLRCATRSDNMRNRCEEALRGLRHSRRPPASVSPDVAIGRDCAPVAPAPFDATAVPA